MDTKNVYYNGEILTTKEFKLEHTDKPVYMEIELKPTEEEIEETEDTEDEEKVSDTLLELLLDAMDTVVSLLPRVLDSDNIKYMPQLLTILYSLYDVSLENEE